MANRRLISIDLDGDTLPDRVLDALDELYISPVDLDAELSLKSDKTTTVTSVNGVLPTAGNVTLPWAPPVGGIIESELSSAVQTKLNAVAKPVGGWLKTDLVAAVQTSLSKADTAVQPAGLTSFAPLASPSFTGTPTAPTAATLTATGQLATTAFVHNVLSQADLKGDQGDPGLVWKGAYSSATQYVTNDAVTFAGSSYRAIVPSLSQAPTNVGFWELLAAKGEPGDASSGIVSWSSITGTPTTFPPSEHTHTVSEVTDLQAALDAKIALSGGALSEGANFIFGTTTGTKFGTATSQKIGFYNATPVIQPVSATELGTVLSSLGLRAAGTAYPITTSGAVSFTGTLTTGRRTKTVTAITANVTLSVTGSSEMQTVDATTAPITINLPTTTIAGVHYTIKRLDASANAVTITGLVTPMIDGATTVALNRQFESITLMSTAVSGLWRIVNRIQTANSLLGATATGQSLMTAADTSAVRTLLGTISDSDPRLTDARTPAAHTHSWAEVTGKPELDLQSVIDVRNFGAPYGTTDDAAAALNAAANEARSKKLPLFAPEGTLYIDSLVNLRYLSVDIQATIVVRHSNDVGVVVGDIASQRNARRISLASVKHAVTGYYDWDWPFPAIRIVGLKGAEINIGNSSLLELFADSGTAADDSTAYNTLSLSRVNHLRLHGVGTGWVNQNLFLGGSHNRVTLSGGYFHNNNKWIATSVEGANSVIDIQRGSQNVFEDVRGEGGTGVKFGLNTWKNTVSALFTSNQSILHGFSLIEDLGEQNLITSRDFSQLSSATLFKIESASTIFDKTGPGLVFTDGANQNGIPIPSVGGGKLAIRSANRPFVDTGMMKIEEVKGSAANASLNPPTRIIRFQLNCDTSILRPQFMGYDANGVQIDPTVTPWARPYAALSAIASSGGYYGTTAPNADFSLVILNPSVKYIRVKILSSVSGQPLFTHISLVAYYDETITPHVVDSMRASIFSNSSLFSPTKPTEGVAQLGTEIVGPDDSWRATARVDTSLTAAASGSTLSVGSATGIAPGDVLGVLLDSGRTHWTSVTSVTGLDVTIATAVPTAASAGAAVSTTRWSVATISSGDISPFGKTLIKTTDAAAVRTAISAVSTTDPRLTDSRTPTAHTHTWAELTSKPTTFDPTAHTHPISDLTATGTRDATTYLRGDGTWHIPPTGGQPGAHTHPWTEITDKPTTFAPAAHTHVISDTTGLQAALDEKAAASHTHTVSQISATGTKDNTTFLRGDGTWSVPPTGGQPGAHTHLSTDISDSTATGRSVLTAATAAAARTAIGAGTGSSDLTIGTTSTTAKVGNYQPAWSDITSKPTTFAPIIGSGAADAVAGNDSRLTNARTPVAHTHVWADLTDKPATFAPTIGATATTAVAGNDSRLTDARTPTAHTHPATGISDSTATGRSVITATDAAAARTAIGAGTSSLALGTTSSTAKAGDYAPTWAEITSKPTTFSPTAHTHLWADLTDKPATFAPSAHTHAYGDLTGIPATFAPTIGSTATTAVAGNDARLSDARTPTAHTHPATAISDSSAVGRSVLTAADAATARTAIGAGTGSSNLALGTTSTTAKAGDYVPTWAEVTSKPTTFAPIIGTTSTTAVAGNDSRLTDARTPTAHSHAWADITSKPTTFAPTAHTHAISEVTNLQATLDGKAATSHVHYIAEVFGLQSELNIRPTSVSGTMKFWRGVKSALPTTKDPDTIYLAREG